MVIFDGDAIMEALDKWGRMMSIRLRHVLGLLTAGFVMAGIVASSAGAIATGGIGGRPANPDPSNPRTESIFIYTLKQGATKNDQLLLSNNTEQTQTINLYAVDGQVTNTGAYTCKQKSEAREDLGNWVNLAESQVTLAASEKKVVDFTVTVPTTADVGEHDACLVFENANDPATTSSGVRIRTRQAIRMVVTVPGNLHRDIEITGFDVAQNEHGNQQFLLSLSNKGNVSADVETNVTLKSLFGSTVFSDGGSYPALPNQKLDLNFTNTKHPFFGGWYSATATISYSKKAGSFGVSNDKSQLITKSSEAKTVFVWPSPYFFVLLAAILLASGVWLWQWTLRRRAIEKWHTRTVVEGDTLESLAEGTGIGWKRIARANHVKAPYTLHVGTKLRIPNKAKTVIKK